MQQPNLEKIARLRAELAEEEAVLHAWKRAAQEQGEQQKLAIALHDKYCSADHTMGCGWLYEQSKDASTGQVTHFWDSPSHVTWLGKTESFIKQVTQLKEALSEKSGYELAHAYLKNSVRVNYWRDYGP